MLDYRIKTFLLLGERMNYRKTAQELGITQPAVTQQIHSLEKQYGCTLFEYRNHQLVKTPAAINLERYARVMQRSEQNFLDSIHNQNSCELHIGATKTVGDYFLNSYIYRFLQTPGNDLDLIVDNTERLLALLEENKLDLAVVEGYFDKQRFDSVLLRKEPFVGICSMEHPFAGKEVTMEALLQQTIIHREEGSGTRAILEQVLREYNESLSRFRRHICISSFKLILDLVKQNYGISFVYHILAQSDPQLATFTIRGEAVVREFNLVYLKDADVQAKIQALLGGQWQKDMPV